MSGVEREPVTSGFQQAGSRRNAQKASQKDRRYPKEACRRQRRLRDRAEDRGQQPNHSRHTHQPRLRLRRLQGSRLRADQGYPAYHARPDRLRLLHLGQPPQPHEGRKKAKTASLATASPPTSRKPISSSAQRRSWPRPYGRPMPSSSRNAYRSSAPAPSDSSATISNLSAAKPKRT